MNKKIKLQPIINLLVLIICPMVLFGQSDKVYSKQEVSSDLTTLKTELLKKHPNIFLYNDFITFHNQYDSIVNSVADSLTIYEAYSTVSSVSKLIKDNHTAITPNKETFLAAFNSALLFPIYTTWNGESLFVNANCTNESDIPEGSSIISINRIEVGELMNYMRLRWPSDGNNTTFFKHNINANFPILYFGFFGSKESFNIRYRIEGDIKAIQIPGETFPNIKSFQKCSTHFRNELTDSISPYLQLHLDQDNKNAFLGVGVFEDELIEKHGQDFTKTISTYFNKIIENQIDTLVIDVRGNSGGMTINMMELLAYLFNEPIQVKYADFIVSKRKWNISNERLKKLRITNKERILKPKKKGYRGTLILLTDGGTCSAAALFSSAIKSYNRGIVIGEETGGSSVVLTGSPIKQFILPNTKIQVAIPERRVQIKEFISHYEGVKPDIAIDLPENIESTKELFEFINKQHLTIIPKK